jgi:hypothetical protein
MPFPFSMANLICWSFLLTCCPLMRLKTNIVLGIQ